MKREYKVVPINQYIKLLEKLQEKALLNSEGGQYSPEEYCVGNTLEAKSFLPNTITYFGKIKMELRGLTDYELAMLMEQEDVIGYKVIKDPYEHFQITIYK